MAVLTTVCYTNEVKPRVNRPHTDKIWGVFLDQGTPNNEPRIMIYWEVFIIDFWQCYMLHSYIVEYGPLMKKFDESYNKDLPKNWFIDGPLTDDLWWFIALHSLHHDLPSGKD